MIRAALCAVSLVAAATTAAAQQEVETGTGAVLRWLDKINGETRDIELPNASGQVIGSLRVELGECRYPAGNPSGDAFAFLTIQTEPGAPPVFSGWMVASSPALNPMEHARYDVWVLNCTTQ